MSNLSKSGQPLWITNAKMFLVSFLILYIELVLIRWIGVEVRIFAYLSNFVLIAAFIGVGIGCFQAQRAVRPLTTLAVTFVIVFLVAEPFGIRLIPFRKITDMLSILPDSLIWNRASWWDQSFGQSILLVVGGISLVLLLFTLVSWAFVPLGRHLGALFEDHPHTIQAYSMNVLGSLLGTWASVAFSCLGWPPWVWFAVFVLLMLFYFPQGLWRRAAWCGLSAAIIVVLLPLGEQTVRTLWSPYQKLEVQPIVTDEIHRGFYIKVNNTGYQRALNLSREFLAAHPDHFDLRLAALGPYEFPFRLKDRIEKMLIVGAGSGNDAAGALRNGVGQVDCVEIDPIIYKIGTELHPEKPYSDPRARMFIDDARSFFWKAQGGYDMVWFGLLDSHTTGTSHNNRRLEGYVYTLESFREARRLMKDDGILVMTFATQAQWMIDRLHGMLKEVFGHEPFVAHLENPNNYFGWPRTLFLAANTDFDEYLERVPSDIRENLRANRIAPGSGVRLTTDDWPFIYLRTASVPPLHLLVSVVLVAILVIFRGPILRARIRVDWKFFFLGAGFLLLEVQSITKTGLLIGSTWISNSFVISQVFIWILLANYLCLRIRIRSLKPIFALLFLDMLLLYFTPLRLFNALDLVPRLILVSLFLTLPVFFAGLIFVRLFSATDRRDFALGSNLIGALCGGLLESLGFVIGIKALLLPDGTGLLRRLRDRGEGVALTGRGRHRPDPETAAPWQSTSQALSAGV